jgi:hypothetical protein
MPVASVARASMREELDWPGVTTNIAMPRFVILRHETSQGVHFDFMFEAGGALKTWSLAEPPRAGVEIECRQLADHRLAYLDYEGPISGGRGSVTRWDRGTYAVEQRSDDRWAVSLAGDKLVGRVTISRSTDAGGWCLLFASPAGPAEG